MVDGKYLIPIEDYRFVLKSEKINSIARLVKLDIPTVPFPHLLLPKSFEFYLKNKELASQAEQGLEILFNKLQKANYTVTVRPSIFAEIPGVEFIVANRLNLPTFKEMIQAITDGYDKIIRKFKRLKEIEFAYLIQGFYTANKAGAVFSNDGLGNIHIEAAFGESTNIFTRGRVTPDVYKIDKKTGKIKGKHIAEKDFTLTLSESGLRKIKLSDEERTKPVFTDKEIKKIYQYALRMEKKHGSQEIECAVLRTGEIIFQSARGSQIKKQKKPIVSTKNIPIFLRKVKGEIIYIHDIQELTNYRSYLSEVATLNALQAGHKMSEKFIVVTDNLNIDFITKLVYRFKPKAVILTQGSLTAHAVTILREARLPSVLANEFKISQQKFVEIKENGEINCYS